MGGTVATFKGLFTSKGTKYNMFLLGMPGAGKTHMLYNSMLVDENWIQTYNQNRLRNNIDGDEESAPTSRYAMLKPTNGFNQEIYLGKREYAIWDIGGALIYGGELAD